MRRNVTGPASRATRSVRPDDEPVRQQKRQQAGLDRPRPRHRSHSQAFDPAGRRPARKRVRAVPADCNEVRMVHRQHLPAGAGPGATPNPIAERTRAESGTTGRIAISAEKPGARRPRWSKARLIPTAPPAMIQTESQQSRQSLRTGLQGEIKTCAARVCLVKETETSLGPVPP